MSIFCWVVDRSGEVSSVLRIGNQILEIANVASRQALPGAQRGETAARTLGRASNKEVSTSPAWRRKNPVKNEEVDGHERYRHVEAALAAALADLMHHR